MRALLKKYLPPIIMIACVIGAGFYIRNDWREHRAEQKYQQQLVRIADLAKIKTETDPRVAMDKLRIFINDHSSHNMDAEFYATWKNPDIMAANIITYATGTRKDYAHMECSTRSQIMHDIAHLMGMRTRTIVVWNPDDRLLSHTFMEFKNPKTNTWEVQDPDYDLTWVNADDQKSRPAFVRVTENLSSALPCGRASCGLDVQSREKTPASNFKHYGRIVTIIDRESGKRASFYGPGVDPDKVYTNAAVGRNWDSTQGTFCGLYPKNCRDGFHPADKYDTVWRD